MARRLLLVRHGDTVGESSIRYYGRTDVALSELGRAQMRAARELLRSRLNPFHFDAVFGSGLSRALEGARIIAGPGAAITAIDDLNEVDFGAFEGLTDDEIKARYPVEYARWNRNRIDPALTYPGGENRGAFTRRVERGATLMLEQVKDGATALLVAHRGVIRAVMRFLCGIAPVIELGSIQIIEEDAGAWRPVALDLLAAPHHAERES